MELILDWSVPTLERERAVFSIGMFDGLHLGHKSLIDMVVAEAAHLKAQSLVLTFEPHPLEILAKQAAPPLLTTLGQKAEILASWGVDRLGVLRFTKEMANLEPHKFLMQYLSKHIEPQMVVLGADFSFGKGGKGGSEHIVRWLEQTAPKARLVRAEPLSGPNGPYSSSQIRQDLKSGLVENVARSLGRPYRLAGEVVHGLARGRILGFPTANMGDIKQLIPEPGAYAVNVHILDEVYQGMTSIGYNPTFGEQPMTVETNIFDFDKYIYGQAISVDFMARLRPMVRFKSAEQLVEQLEKDRQDALTALA